MAPLFCKSQYISHQIKSILPWRLWRILFSAFLEYMIDDKQISSSFEQFALEYYVNFPDFHIWSRTMAMILSSYSVPETMIPWSEGLPLQVKYSSETVASDQGNVLDYASVSEIIFSCILTWHFYFALAKLQMNSVCPCVIWPLCVELPILFRHLPVLHLLWIQSQGSILIF